MSQHPVSNVDPETRAKALKSLLMEKDLVSSEAFEVIPRKYEEEIGPWRGAKIVAKAWTDSSFKERLLQKPSSVINQLGYTGLEGVDIDVCENTPEVHNVIVCTLCSCFPWSVLGLPPTWYKMPPYRSKMVKRPRETLREEFDVTLDGDVEVRVWDTSAELRYMILPQRPQGSEDMSEERLVELITPESMIGVDRLGNKHVDNFT